MKFNCYIETAYEWDVEFITFGVILDERYGHYTPATIEIPDYLKPEVAEDAYGLKFLHFGYDAAVINTPNPYQPPYRLPMNSNGNAIVQIATQRRNKQNELEEVSSWQTWIVKRADAEGEIAAWGMISVESENGVEIGLPDYVTGRGPTATGAIVAALQAQGFDAKDVGNGTEVSVTFCGSEYVYICDEDDAAED